VESVETDHYKNHIHHCYSIHALTWMFTLTNAELALNTTTQNNSEEFCSLCPDKIWNYL